MRKPATPNSRGRVKFKQAPLGDLVLL
jgi:hypothetical protein